MLNNMSDADQPVSASAPVVRRRLSADERRRQLVAIGRRMLRTTAPDEGATGVEQVETVTRLMIEQIERRRGFYLALVHGHGVADPRVSEVMDSVRDGSTERVMTALEVPEARR